METRRVKNNSIKRINSRNVSTNRISAKNYSSKRKLPSTKRITKSTIKNPEKRTISKKRTSKRVVKKKLRLKKKPIIILLLLLLTPSLIIFLKDNHIFNFKIPNINLSSIMKSNEEKNTTKNSDKKKTTQNTNTTKKTTTNTIKKEPPYYKEENKKRYEAYQQKHKDLSHEDVVTRVNIGLDYDGYTHTKETDKKDTYYVLVNKYNYLPKDYVPKNLEKVNEKYSSGNKKLAHEARVAFEDLAKSAKKENINIRAASTYRSYSYQNQLYNNYVLSSGAKAANRFSAKPGFSEHQTGLAIDCDNKYTNFQNFENTDAFKWMDKNAHKYGFILRYPKEKEHITGYMYESWHYRYVGVEIASYIKKNNITFDEYYVRFIDR